jgi:hypothetical protein
MKDNDLSSTEIYIGFESLLTGGKLPVRVRQVFRIKFTQQQKGSTFIH